MSETTTLIEAGETHLPIPDTYGLAWVEWNHGDPVIVWSEPLGFHLANAGEGKTTLHPGAVQEWLNAHLAELYGAERFTAAVTWADWEDDFAPVLEIRVSLKPKLDPQTLLLAAYEALWPAIATLFNVTDPGTYNSPYMFSTLFTEE